MRVTNSDLTKISKYISLILRHKPEVIGIQLDANGWANVEALLAGIGRKYPIDFEVLEEIVRTDNKQRYSFNEDKTKIRANQGHSIQVDVELSVTEPPEILYHGTAERFSASIEAKGLLPGTDYMFICLLIQKQQKKWDADMENQLFIWSMQGRCSRMDTLIFYPPMVYG